MSGSGWGRHSKSCCKPPLGNVAVNTAWRISHGPATSSTTGVWNVLCHIYQQQKKWWENVIFTIRVLSRLTVVLTWATSLGWTSPVTCCNIYMEYHVPVLFEFLHHIRTSILLASSLKWSSIWNVTRSISRVMWTAVFAEFCFILVNM